MSAELKTGTRLRMSMRFAFLSLLLVFVVGDQPELGASPGGSPPIAAWLAAEPSRPDSAASLVTPLPLASVSSSENTQQDDEVEMPDEEEDDEPDDLGQAIHHTGRTAPAAVLPELPPADRPALPASPKGPLPALGECRGPRFLCLCRFLI